MHQVTPSNQKHSWTLLDYTELEFIRLATTEEEKEYTFAVNKGFMLGEGTIVKRCELSKRTEPERPCYWWVEH